MRSLGLHCQEGLGSKGQASSSREHSWNATDEDTGIHFSEPRTGLCHPRLVAGDGKLSVLSPGELDPVSKSREHPMLASCGLLWSVKGQRLPWEVITVPQGP